MTLAKRPADELFGGKRNTVPPPGRPKGSRNKLAGRFFDDLHALWSEQGESVLARAAFHEPMAFAAMVAKLMPQKLEISTPTSGMTDERLEQLIAFAEAMAAAKAGVAVPVQGYADAAPGVGGGSMEGRDGETGGGGPVVLGPSGVGVPPIHYLPNIRDGLSPAAAENLGTLINVTPAIAPDGKPALKPFSRGAIPRPPVPAINPLLDQARALAHGRDAETENSHDDEPDLSIFD